LSIPNHIAIIPDGNRRWAKAQRLNPWEGHSAGSKRFWDIADVAYEAGVKYATFWAASYDNLSKRSKMEVAFLLDLLKAEVNNPQLWERLHANKVRVVVKGEWRDFVTDKETLESIEKLVSDTKHFDEKTLTLLFAYDGQREMLAATRALAESGEEVTAENLRKNLWTSDLPDVDLVVRTGGEPHWSAGFMMWLTASSEFYFSETLWPAFSDSEFNNALELFVQRDRKLGK
jgi:undecaprenyl diphosphate synthase